MKPERAKNIWTYMVSARRFKLGVILMILAVLLSFISIYISIETVTQTYEWDAAEDEYLEPVNLYSPYRALSNNLSVSYYNGENATATVVVLGEDIDYDNPLHNFTVMGGESRELTLQENATFIKPYFEHGKMEMEYTVEYLSYPYALLFIPAIVLSFSGIIFIYGSYSNALDHMAEDIDRMDLPFHDYRSPVEEKEGKER